MEQQIADAKNEHLAYSHCARNGGRAHNWAWGRENPCGYGCDQWKESDKERKAREAKEEKDLKLQNLNSNVQIKMHNRLGRKERMAYFFVVY